MNVPGALAGAVYQFDNADLLSDAQQLPTWQAALNRQMQQRAELTGCLLGEKSCPPMLRSLRHILERARELDAQRQVRLVNGYINRRTYRRDRRLAQPLSLAPGNRLRSHWSTMFEFMRRGGDCEDYATAKYFMLRELGFTVDDLRVVITRDHRERTNHAVLAWRHPDGKVWLLDTDKIRHKLLSYQDFRFALNEKSIWDHEGPG